MTRFTFFIRTPQNGYRVTGVSRGTCCRARGELMIAWTQVVAKEVTFCCCLVQNLGWPPVPPVSTKWCLFFKAFPSVLWLPGLPQMNPARPCLPAFAPAAPLYLLSPFTLLCNFHLSLYQCLSPVCMLPPLHKFFSSLHRCHMIHSKKIAERRQPQGVLSNPHSHMHKYTTHSHGAFG